ncbi:MAG: SPASM domain-containing protein, partial [Bacteroidia bacterium]|nr:SPASM domain-containing protein [Bacteroidia bacterium]
MSVFFQKERGSFRKKLAELRTKVPFAVQLTVWKQLINAVFERNQFEKQIPLFRSVGIETRTRCNSKCTFCAASILTDQRTDKYIPEDLMQKILLNLQDLQFSGSIQFFINNEPLLDPRLPTFIRQARELIPSSVTVVHTYGLKLYARSGKELLESGLQILQINNYSDDGKIPPGVTAFLEEVAPQYPDRIIRFTQRRLTEQLLNRAGTAPNGETLSEPLPLPCILPFDQLSITVDGRTTICCQDHYFEEITGNVYTQRLEEIWYGEAFQKIRNHLLKADRSVSKFCQVCDFRG